MVGFLSNALGALLAIANILMHSILVEKIRANPLKLLISVQNIFFEQK